MCMLPARSHRTQPASRRCTPAPGSSSISAQVSLTIITMTTKRRVCTPKHADAYAQTRARARMHTHEHMKHHAGPKRLLRGYRVMLDTPAGNDEAGALRQLGLADGFRGRMRKRERGPFGWGEECIQVRQGCADANRYSHTDRAMHTHTTHAQQAHTEAGEHTHGRLTASVRSGGGVRAVSCPKRTTLKVSP